MGVVRLWPEKAAAEHENLARIRIAAAKIGIDIIEIDRDGCLLGEPGIPVDSTLVDFVLHLHYETPKNYDAFSYGALWNPPDLYVNWGYETYYYHQLTHDGYVSPGAVAAEDLIVRGRPHEFARGSFPILNHSLAEPIIPPRPQTDRRIFYCGVNWERIGHKTGRHATLLEELDAADCMEIYGPEKIEGIAPWAGYKNYRGALPFDGVSLVKAASRAGAVLVFSSDMHRRSGIMSNRLFEALASGAVIIGDSHAFLARHFSDCVLVVDDTAPAEEQARQIMGHLAWANNHPAEAVDLATRAQRRFVEHFRLDAQLASLYRHFFAAEEAATARRRAAEDRELLSILFAPLSRTGTFPENLAKSLQQQTSSRFEIVAAAGDAEQARLFEAALAGFLPGERFKVVNVGALSRAPIGNFGAVIGALVDAAAGSIAVAVQGHEWFFRSFVAASLQAFTRQGGGSVATASVLIRHSRAGAVPTHLYVTSRLGPHAGAIAATLLRTADYRKHRPLLDYLGADLWHRVILGGLLGPVFPTFVPQMRSELPAYEARVRTLEESTPLVSAPDAVKLIASYRPVTGEGLPSGVNAMINPAFSHRDVFDPEKYAALSIKQRQKFGRTS